jgi:hypothetical protein
LRGGSRSRINVRKATTMKRENGECGTVCIVAAAEGKARTTKHVDYVAELNKLGMAGRAESDNAAPFYKRAVELCVKFPEQQMNMSTRGWPSDLPERYLSALRNWVQVNSEAFSQMELGSKKSYFWFRLSSPDGTLYSVLTPRLTEYRNLSQAISWRAKLAAAGGSSDKAVTDIVTCYRFGLHIQTGGAKGSR